MFDWPDFLRRHRIEYVTSGPSITKGNIAVACPWCGSADAGHHMGISLLGRGWRCWRNPAEHKGRHPFRLVRALLGCSTAEALRITGSTSVPTSTDLLEAVTDLLEPKEIVDEREPPKLPETFRHLTDGYPASLPYRHYLDTRGYHDDDLPWLDELGIRYATRGMWRGRILFPVYLYGQLVSWTGRTVWSADGLRYRTLSVDGEKARRGGDRPAVVPINHSLLWHDRLLDIDADTFVAVEGPFDALRIEKLARHDGVAATCLFGAVPTGPQLLLLYDLLPRFKHCYLLLDHDMSWRNYRLGSQLAATNKLVAAGLAPRFLPSDLKDPGDIKMTRGRLWRVLEESA